MAAVNQQWKETMKRLMLDLKELQNSPIPVVSAAPLEDNFREWHCNIVCDGLVVHVIVFIEENYPYAAPKAEFMPMGLRFPTGAQMSGTKGTQLCMSLLSNYSHYHQEWKTEENYGWSPGYTMQSLLLNLLSYLEDLKFKTPENEKLITDFTCPDCGHSPAMPYPPMNEENADNPGSSKMDARTDQMIKCYISKETMNACHSPKEDAELFGFGLEHYGPKAHPFISSPCEFMTHGAFYNMKETFGLVQSSVKEEISDFLPLFLHPNHGKCIKADFDRTIGALSPLFQKGRSRKTQTTTPIVSILPNLMATTLEDFTNALEGSDNLLTGFFAFHRLFLWAVDTYPDLQDKIDEKIETFLSNEYHRCKKFSQHPEELIMLISVSSKYRWHDVAEVYLSEIWRRDVLDYVEKDGLLGDLDTDMKYRMEKTFSNTQASRKGLATQIVFLNTAVPPGMSRDDVISRYDSNLGYPTTDMVNTIRESCQRIRNVKTYQDMFEVLNLTPISDEQVFNALVTSVKYAIKTIGYHRSGNAGTGGWKDLRLMTLRKKRQRTTATSNKKDVNPGKISLPEIPEIPECARELPEFSREIPECARVPETREEKMEFEQEGANPNAENIKDAEIEAMEVGEEQREKQEQIPEIRPIPEVKELQKLQRNFSFNVTSHSRKRKVDDDGSHKWFPKRSLSCAAF